MAPRIEMPINSCSRPIPVSSFRPQSQCSSDEALKITRVDSQAQTSVASGARSNVLAREAV
jgi:hypothetical protein